MRSPILPILWAQWRIFTSPRMGSSRGLGIASALVWYVLWAGLGYIAASTAQVLGIRALAIVLPWILFAVSGYWQLMPIATASLGMTLDLRRLLAWPIPERSLFGLEILLRATTTLEMLVFLLVAGAGLALHRVAPVAGIAAAVGFVVVINMFVAAGLRSLVERVFARKWLREIAVLLLVLAAALPPLLISARAGRAPQLAQDGFWFGWPWEAAAHLALGDHVPEAVMVLLGWTAAAYAFGRWQFRRSLSFDFDTAAEARASTGPRTRLDAVFRLPSVFFNDPLAALVEKELRTLAHAPRFRLVFVMGFSFGFLIWLPIMGEPEVPAVLRANFPALVAVYGLVLLAEVVIWNVFGFDRAAARLYYTAPVRLSTVLIAKNLATLAVVLLEVSIIAVVAALLPLGVPMVRVFEALLVAMVASEYLLATGNLSSVYYPKGVDPGQSWGRQASTRFHFYLLLLFPVLLSPVLLAYVARWAFASDAAFYGVLGFAAVVGALYYRVALQAAVEAASRRRDVILERLAAPAGPLSAD
ncbi:MAG: hypothetical protein ACM3ZB_03835 [bacterium]|jgi:ABC-2 type transport system permease protein